MLSAIRGKRLVYIGIAVLVIVAALLLGFLARGKDQPVVAGQNIVVTVQSSSFENMYGYQFRLGYNPNEVEYVKDTLTSKNEEIVTIFSKPYPEYELVGATMIGDKRGISGRNKDLCELVFTAKKDGMLSEFLFSVNDVNVVTLADVSAELGYEEGVEGWRYKLSVQEQPQP